MMNSRIVTIFVVTRKTWLVTDHISMPQNRLSQHTLYSFDPCTISLSVKDSVTKAKLCTTSDLHCASKESRHSHRRQSRLMPWLIINTRYNNRMVEEDVSAY